MCEQKLDNLRSTLQTLYNKRLYDNFFGPSNFGDRNKSLTKNFYAPLNGSLIFVCMSVLWNRKLRMIEWNTLKHNKTYNLN